MKRKTYLFVGLLMILSLSACEDLIVENNNSPTFNETNLPTAAYGKAGSLLNSQIFVNHTFNEPLLAWLNAADIGTCSWGNFGMRDVSSEPRIAYNNTPGYSSRLGVENYYMRIYSYSSIANDILNAIANDVNDEVQEPDLCKAIALYTQAYCLGHQGLFFDKGFIVTDHTDLTVPQEFKPYTEVIDSALAICDKAIALCATADFTIPATWLPSPDVYTEVELGRLVNTLAARLLAYKSRNATQDAANDWAKILTYANNGIQKDYTVIMDDVTWYNYYLWYHIRDTWGRTDMRVISMMSTGGTQMYPWFPIAGTLASLPNSGVATSPDARLGLYFMYLSSQNFIPSRGIYHYSTYRLKRYDTYRNTFLGPLPIIMKWENDMLKAEAIVRSGGSAATAAAILNNAAGPRKLVGGLPDVAAVNADILAAIYYEKTVECMVTTTMTEFYDMRRRDMLQKGTPLHLPVPAQQLEVLGLPFYTFGGTTGVEGEDYSAGGWDKEPGFYNKTTYGYPNN